MKGFKPMSDQLPESKRHAATQQLLASLRRDRRKDPVPVSCMLKLPADLLNTLRQRKGREDAA